MADPQQQQYTDAQLSDGRTLRFLGDLNPDQVRAKVQDFRARESLTRPDLYGAPTGPMPGSPQTQPMQYGPEGLESSAETRQYNAGAGLPGMTGNRPVTEKDLIPGLAVAAPAAAYMGGAAALPFLKPLLPAVKAGAKVGIGTAATEAVLKGAKSLPGIGGYISKMPGIDYLPWLVGMATGGKSGASETSEPAPPSTDQIPGRPYQPNPRFEPPPEPDPLPPRTGPLFLKGQVATPEQLNPSLISPARALPGQISSERIYGPRPMPAEPIPPRQGLMLPGQVEQPAQAAQPTDYRKLPWSSMLERSLGNEPMPIKPGVPIREQNAPELTPVESSAVKGYRYDAQARELHVQPRSGGTTYVYGDVSPEDAQAFAESDSKGKAWQQIQAGNPLVRKGARAVKPTSQGADFSDMTDMLTRSLPKR